MPFLIPTIGFLKKKGGGVVVPPEVVGTTGINYSNTGSTINVALPAGTAEGDLMIITAGDGTNNNNVVGPGAGWTEFHEFTVGGGQRREKKAFWKRVEAGETDPAVVTITAMSDGFADMIVVRNSGLPVILAENDASTDPLTDSYTDPVENALELYSILVKDEVGSNSATITPISFDTLSSEQTDALKYLAWKHGLDEGTINFEVDFASALSRGWNFFRARIRTPDYAQFIGADGVDQALDDVLSLTLPTGTAEGDLLILFASVHIEPADLIGPTTSGWVKMADLENLGIADGRQVIWWKYAEAGETSPDVTFDPADVTYAGLLVFRNAGPPSLEGAQIGDTTDPIVSASYTDPVEGFWDAVFTLGTKSGSGSSGINPSGWTTLKDEGNFIFSNFRTSSQFMSYREGTDSGTTSYSLNVNGTHDYVLHRIRVHPKPFAPEAMVGSDPPTAGTSTSIAITIPSNVQEGDLLIAYGASVDDIASGDFEGPSTSGWTLLSNTVNTSGTRDLRQKVWYKYAGSAEADFNMVISEASPNQTAAGLYCFSDSALPLMLEEATGTATDPITATSYTDENDGHDLILVAGQEDGSSTNVSVTTTTPTSFITEWEEHEIGAANDSLISAASYRRSSDAGSIAYSLDLNIAVDYILNRLRINPVGDPSFVAQDPWLWSPSGANVVMSIPVGTRPGDLLIAVGVARDATSTAITGPSTSGWTELSNVTNSGTSNMQQIIYFKFAEVGETTPTMNFTAGNDSTAAALYVFRNVNGPVVQETLTPDASDPFSTSAYTDPAEGEAIELVVSTGFRVGDAIINGITPASFVNDEADELLDSGTEDFLVAGYNLSSGAGSLTYSVDLNDTADGVIQRIRMGKAQDIVQIVGSDIGFRHRADQVTLSGSDVESMTDISGNGVVISDQETLNRPSHTASDSTINGRSSLTFVKASQENLEFDTPYDHDAEFTLVAVVKNNDGAADRSHVFLQRDPGDVVDSPMLFLGQSGSAGQPMFWDSTVGERAQHPTQYDGEWAMYVWRFRQSSIYRSIAVNGGAETVNTTGSQSLGSFLALGFPNVTTGADFTFAEMFLVRSMITEQQQLDLLGFYNGYYGLALS